MKYVYAIWIGVTLIACGPPNEEAPEKPDNLLSYDEMIEIMTDVQLAESYVRNGRHNIDSIMPNAFYDHVWEKHALTKEDLEVSLSYYALFPDTLERIYEEVINELTEKQAAIESEMEANNEG